jgi:hypothetical protein
MKNSAECSELKKQLQVIQQTLMTTIEIPVRDDYTTNIRSIKLQENIKVINEIKKQMYDKCY